MIPIISLLVVISISILITRVATIALAHTGLSTESARFQARSAFTNAGFTTSESERVVNHPVRRRIILILIMLGHAGVVGAVSSLMLAFLNTGSSTSMALRIVLIAAGIGVLWLLATSPWVDRYLSGFINWALNRFTRLNVADYASLMHLAGDYRIVEIRRGSNKPNSSLQFGARSRHAACRVYTGTSRTGRAHATDNL